MAGGGCAAMVAGGLLRRMRQDVSAYRMAVEGERRESHPKVFTDITVEHTIDGSNLDAAKVRDAIALATSRYCPVVLMPAQATRVQHRFHIRDSVSGDMLEGSLD